MPRSRALCLCVPLALLGCGKDIVLGDSESALPAMPSTAGAGAGGMSSSGGASGSTAAAGSAGSSGSPSVGGMAGSAAGMPGEVVPEPGEVVWWADHGTGDFSEWEDGGDYYGGEYEWGSGSFSVDDGIGRNDSRGLVTTIDTDFRDDPSQGVRVYRRIQDEPAFYSVWLKLEGAHRPSEWWSIVLFHAREDTTSLENDVSLWDVRVVEDEAGAMTLQFFDHDTMLGSVHDSAGRIQPGAWFELTAYLDYRPPSETRLRILHNGALLFDMKALHTSLEENVFWALGNGADELTPNESTIYVDDAAIRLTAVP